MNIGFVCSKTRGGIGEDDAYLATELETVGHNIDTVFWDDPKQDWRDDLLYINRCTWDYHLDPAKFYDWLNFVKDKNLHLLNSPDIIIKNISKKYLLGHEESIPTTFLEHEQIDTLNDVIHQLDYDELVIKPAIGASGYLTYKLHKSNLNLSIICEIMSLYRQLKRDMIIQPYLSEIETFGEYSLIFFKDEFSHAIHKLPSIGEYRVQSRYGGQTKLVEDIDHHIIVQAQKILARLGEIPLYARVDGIWDGENFTLGELELNEPYLWFQSYPPAINKFIKKIERCCNDN